jgi:hypothetical protein
MMSFDRFRGVLSALTLIGGLGMASGAMAQSSSSMSLVQGATTGLGAHHRFTTVAAAASHCPGDTIVWSNGKSMTYHAVSSGASGMARHGFYACKMEADSAGFRPVN